MPSHVVCETCGWREPVIGTTPKATRTWDSTRDEERYEREKKRRAAADHRRLLASAQLAKPNAKHHQRRRESNVVEMKRAIGK